MLPHLKILLVEDDELFRLGLKFRLQQETEIATLIAAEDGETAIELASKQSFDAVLLDIGLPGIGGLETCRQLKAQHPYLPILVLTSRTEPALIARLVEYGAQGYCLKGISAESLILAMRSVIAGASWWDAAATSEIRTTFQHHAGELSDSAAINLTSREQEILTLVATNKTNQEIAELLYITPGTVRVHVHTILHKLGARDRQQAVEIAARHNLIEK
jgi:two-component system, NarL family, response regulator